MKQGMTIQETLKEIMRQSEAKADYGANTQNMHLETCDGIPVLRLLDNQGQDRVEPLGIMPTGRWAATWASPGSIMSDCVCQGKS